MFTSGKIASGPESDLSPLTASHSCYPGLQLNFSWWHILVILAHSQISPGQHICVTQASAKFFHDAIVTFTGSKGLRKVCAFVQHIYVELGNQSLICYWTWVHMVRVYNAVKMSYIWGIQLVRQYLGICCVSLYFIHGWKKKKKKKKNCVWSLKITKGPFFGWFGSFLQKFRGEIRRWLEYDLILISWWYRVDNMLGPGFLFHLWTQCSLPSCCMHLASFVFHLVIACLYLKVFRCYPVYIQIF